MSTRSGVFNLALAGILGAIAASAARAPMEVMTVPSKPGGVHYLNESELRRFQQLALTGDLTASNCLTNYYSLSASPDNPDRLYWILIGAENGDADSMMVIASAFERSPIQRERDRAEFWRSRALATKSQVNVRCH